ncbi:MAG: AtpZ/AtpI family protein [Isosphaeraceae bacterium]
MRTVPNDVTTPEPRSPLSAGLQWASRITSLGLMFALPTLAGVYIDRQFGSSPVGTLVGAVVGFVTGMVQLLQIARSGQNPKPTPGPDCRGPKNGAPIDPPDAAPL